MDNVSGTLLGVMNETAAPKTASLWTMFLVTLLGVMKPMQPLNTAHYRSLPMREGSFRWEKRLLLLVFGYSITEERLT